MEQVLSSATDLYGVVAEYDSPEALIAAANRAREAGYKHMDGYSPMPVEGLSEAIGYRHKKFGVEIIPLTMLLGGITGCLTGLIGQWFAFTKSYPLNVGGKPFFAWPIAIVPAFEMTIGFAALSGVFGMLIMNGLPMPYHSIFNTPNFSKASSDTFFLCIEASDPQFDLNAVHQLLADTHAVNVSEVQK